MYCLENSETFDIVQKLILSSDEKALEGHRVVSKHAYCIFIGSLDEEKKAELEDEEIRCA